MAFLQIPDLENVFFRKDSDGQLVIKWLREKFNIFGIEVEYWYLPRHAGRPKPPYTLGNPIYDEPVHPDLLTNDVINDWDFDGPHKLQAVLTSIEDIYEPDDKGAQEEEHRELYVIREDVENTGAVEVMEPDVIGYNGAYFDVVEAFRYGWMNPGMFFMFHINMKRRTKFEPERRLPESIGGE